MARVDYASDKNCDCGLELGSSEDFKTKMKALHKDIPRKQRDNLFDIFTDAEGKAILDNMKAGIKKHYPDVDNGSKKDMCMFPSEFQYGKGKEATSIAPKGAEEKIAKLETDIQQHRSICKGLNISREEIKKHVTKLVTKNIALQKTARGAALDGQYL